MGTVANPNLSAMGEDEEMTDLSLPRRRKHRQSDGGDHEIEDLDADEIDGEVSIEKVFEGKRVPTWREQLTFRAFVVSFFLSVMFCVIVMKLNLTTGIIPSLNVSAGLLGFFFVKSWTKGLEKIGFLKQPFTRQENTVIQTCVVAAYGIAFSGGFGGYLFGISPRIAKQTTEVTDAQNSKDPQLGWMIGFLFVVSFLGLFSLVPLRKIMIIDYELIYPSGTATAHLINGFHTPQGAKLAEKQVKTLGKFFGYSFLWGFFQWFFTAGSVKGKPKIEIYDKDRKKGTSALITPAKTYNPSTDVVLNKHSEPSEGKSASDISRKRKKKKKKNKKKKDEAYSSNVENGSEGLRVSSRLRGRM